MKKMAIASSILLFLGACSTSHVVTRDDGTVVGEVKETGPAWAVNPGRWEAKHKGERAFVGISTVKDWEIARTDAKFNALASLSDRIRTDVHHLFVSGVTSDGAVGDEEAQKAIENGILAVSQAVVSGAHVDRYRLFYTKTPAGVTFTTYALVILSDQAYQKAVADSLDGLKKEVRDPKAAAVVEEMKRRFLKSEANNG